MPRTKGQEKPKPRKIRVLLADPEALILEAFAALLRQEFEIVGAVTDGRALLEEYSLCKPDVVVLDVAMPTLSGLEAGSKLAASYPSAKLVYLTTNPDPRIAAQTARLGAKGYVSKSAPAAELTEAIRRAASAQSSVEAMKPHPSQDRPSAGLTHRQQEVLQLIAEGRSMKEVAHILHVTPRTVAFHKYNIMERLRVRNTAELVHFAVKQGVLAEGAGRGLI